MSEIHHACPQCAEPVLIAAKVCPSCKFPIANFGENLKSSKYVEMEQVPYSEENVDAHVLHPLNTFASIIIIITQIIIYQYYKYG